MTSLQSQPSATCLLILVGLKLTAVNVILIGFDVGAPFLRQRTLTSYLAQLDLAEMNLQLVSRLSDTLF